MPKKVRSASEFGERLAALRQARGLAQVQLAEMIGSTQRAVSRYEPVADRAVIRLVNSLVVAKAFEKSSDDRRRRASG